MTNETVVATEQTPLEAATNKDGNLSLKCGYLVGVTDEGALVFRPIGSALGVVELLGLHAYASARLKTVLDTNQGTGDALTMRVLEVLKTDSGVENLTTYNLGDEKGDQ